MRKTCTGSALHVLRHEKAPKPAAPRTYRLLISAVVDMLSALDVSSQAELIGARTLRVLEAVLRLSVYPSMVRILPRGTCKCTSIAHPKKSTMALCRAALHTGG